MFHVVRGKAHQVVDDVEPVIRPVLRVDPAMPPLPHVVPQGGFVPEGLLAVQALQAGADTALGQLRPSRATVTRLGSHRNFQGWGQPCQSPRHCVSPALWGACIFKLAKLAV